MPTQVDDELEKYAAKPASQNDELEKYASAPATDEVEEYLKHGGKTTASTPEEQLPGGTARLKAATGGKALKPPTRTELETPKIPENYGFTLGNVAHAVGRGLGNVYDLGKNLVSDITNENKPLLWGHSETEGPEESTLHKYVFRPQEEQAEIARQYEQRASQEPFLSREGLLDATIGTGHRIAAGLPLIGPWVAGHAEQAGKGDVGGALGETAGEMAGGELAHRIGAHPVETVKTLGKVADKAVRGTPLTEEGKLAAAKEQALTVKKPTMTETEYAGKVDAAMPELQRIAQENKGQIKTPRAAVRAINDRIAQIEAPIGQHLETVPDAQQMVTVQSFRPRIEQAIDDALARNEGHYTAEEMQKAKDKVLNFVGDQDKPLRALEGNRRRLNQDAEQYFHSDTAGKRSIDVSDATAVAQRAAGNEIRAIEYGDANAPGELERVGVKATDAQGQPVNLRAVRKTVGNLIDVRDHFEDAITRAENTGDWSAFNVMKSGPSLAMGGIGAIAGGATGGPMGAVLGTLLGEGAKAWADYRASKNPNLNVTKMFRNLEQTSAPNTVDVRTHVPPAQPPAPAAAQPVPFRAPVAAPVPPPSVAAPYRLEPIGSVTSTGQLGMRGTAGARTPSLLPARVGEVEPSPAPPPVQPAFVREETGPLGNIELDPERQLGEMGRGGVSTTPRALLPNLSMATEHAKSLIEQTLGMMESGDRPGRYFDEVGQNEAHYIRESPKEGIRHGGRWRGVKSMRTMLPWLRDTEFTPEDLRAALKAIEKGKMNGPVVRSALNYVKGDEYARLNRGPEELPAEAIGDEGTLERLPERITTPAWVLNPGDTFIDNEGDPRTVESVEGDEIKTKDGTDRTYHGAVEHEGDLNSPESKRKKK